MTEGLRCISPVDGRVYAERPLADDRDVRAAVTGARRAQSEWRRTPLAERQAILARAVDHFVAKREEIAEEISWQMGRPIRHSPLEVGGFEERARYMIEIAGEALDDIAIAPREGFRRFIRREPLGVVLVIAPWNYPYLTAVNALMPALVAGNSVILRHSAQTPLCAERFGEAFAAAGLPSGVFQPIHMGHETTLGLIKSAGGANAGVDFVAFTGSVRAGHAVQRAAADRFIGLGLELGGKDPAYVRRDANLAHAVENLVDGAFFNCGQSCCGIERIYVDEAVYDDFVDGFQSLAGAYRLGDPLDRETTLGPMVRADAADFVRAQAAEAVAKGAKALIDAAAFAADKPGTPYLAPQVLIDVDHDMRVMREESFGPIVGIMKVADDAEAVRSMNDSAFGLTASIWTSDQSAAIALGDQVETGTWFMNRCDYLDPALAWTGVKDSGRGCSLSRLGFEQLTRPKSFHLRVSP